MVIFWIKCSSNNPCFLSHGAPYVYTCCMCIFTCFVMLLTRAEVCMCVCILAIQCATLAFLFWHSIYRPVIWGLSFSLHPKFLCPCATKISLCVCVNHLSYAHAPLRKGQGCHLIPAALLSYLCVSYSRPLAVSQLGYPSTLFIPIAPTYGHKTFFYVSKMLPQIKPEQHASLFVQVINYIN